MKQKLVKYRVYDKKGRYNHSYLLIEDARYCANYIGGTAKEILTDGTEKSIV